VGAPRFVLFETWEAIGEQLKPREKWKRLK